MFLSCFRFFFVCFMFFKKKRGKNEPTTGHNCIYRHVLPWSQKAHEWEHGETRQDAGGHVNSHQQQAVSAMSPEQDEANWKKSGTSDAWNLTCSSQCCTGCSFPGRSALRQPETRSKKHDSLPLPKSGGRGGTGESAQSFFLLSLLLKCAVQSPNSPLPLSLRILLFSTMNISMFIVSLWIIFN